MSELKTLKDFKKRFEDLGKVELKSRILLFKDSLNLTVEALLCPD